MNKEERINELLDEAMDRYGTMDFREMANYCQKKGVTVSHQAFHQTYLRAMKKIRKFHRSVFEEYAGYKLQEVIADPYVLATTRNGKRQHEILDELEEKRTDIATRS